MIKLTPDQIEATDNIIKVANFALLELRKALVKERLEADFAKTTLSLIEMKMADISKQISVPTQTQADIEERHAKIAAANAKIRELERQLAESAQIDQTAKQIPLLIRKFTHWWRINGFGHTSEAYFEEYAFEAKVSGHLFGHHDSRFSKTPVSDRQSRAEWLQSLLDRGYILLNVPEDRSSGEAELLNCDRNTGLIQDLFKEHFPSSEVMEINNYARREGNFVIKDIRILIRDIREIDALKAPDDE
ncbi:hypothetical protein [Methylobacter tundripaludum]